MKGLLAGKITRNHQFATGDSRPGYPIFQGQVRAAVHDALDEIARIGKDLGLTTAQLAVGWTISQPLVTAALVGARRPEQIQETIGTKSLPEDVVALIDQLTEPARRAASALD